MKIRVCNPKPSEQYLTLFFDKDRIDIGDVIKVTEIGYLPRIGYLIEIREDQLTIGSTAETTPDQGRDLGNFDFEDIEVIVKYVSQRDEKVDTASSLNPCEVCGQPATCGCQDIAKKLNVSGTYQNEPNGPIHWFCNEHKRDSITTNICPPIRQPWEK